MATIPIGNKRAALFNATNGKLLLSLIIMGGFAYLIYKFTEYSIILIGIVCIIIVGFWLYQVVRTNES